jgi:hypothetical protein
MKAIKSWHHSVVATACAAVVGLVGVLLFVRFDAPDGPEPIGPAPAAAVRSGSAEAGNAANGKGIPPGPGSEYTYNPSPGPTAPAPTDKRTNAIGGVKIVNRGTGLCLQPIGIQGQSIYANGVRIVQGPCNGTAPQLWRAILLGQGTDPLDRCDSPLPCPRRAKESYYYVVNYLTGLCLDVKDASTRDGAVIQQYSCNGGGSEKWFERGSSSGAMYVNARTGKCLDIPGGSTLVSYIWQYHCTDPNNPNGPNLSQIFTFPNVTA